ncbi:MAG: hypothetical protein K9W43_13445 [Candidatus Thorarchaeota archaeon]|nr:hypothetical protein [Candidatus Thorarchaeota archaeon]
MSRIELHTSIEEIISCEDIPGFSIKKINLGRTQIWTPTRAIYLSTFISPSLRKKILSVNTRNAIYGLNRIIYQKRTYDALASMLLAGEEERIKKALKINEELSRTNTSISISFSDFPTRKLGKRFTDLLDYMHAYSSVVFIPHVRYGVGKTKIKYSPIEFCKYVDVSASILQERNTKPIFAPFDIGYDANTRDTILSYYASRGYTNIWIDFQGRGFSNTMIAKMRGMWRGINNHFEDKSKNVVIYLANIRKTPRKSSMDIRQRPSDFLGAFSYGDIIGPPWKGISVPPRPDTKFEEDEEYWRKKGFANIADYRVAAFNRDCSIFENRSYYYLQPDQIVLQNRILDSIRKGIIHLRDASNESFSRKKQSAEKTSYALSGLSITEELNLLRAEVEREGSLLEYIATKEFFRDEMGAVALEKLIRKSEADNQSSLFDFDI